MLVNLESEEPIIGEPTNEQLAEASDLEWFTDDANLFSLLSTGYIVDNGRTRKIVHSLSSFTELGSELAYASNAGTAAKIYETPITGQETYRSLARSLRATCKNHQDSITRLATPARSERAGQTSTLPPTMSGLRLNFLSDAADELLRQPGTEIPVKHIDMTSLTMAGMFK